MMVGLHWLLLLLCGTLVAGTIVRPSNAEPSSAVPCCEHGLLFRLDPEADGKPPSWLFGTIHSNDPRVTQLPAPVQAAFDSAAVVVLEVVPDAAMLEASRTAMVLDPDEHLEELLPPVLYQGILAVFAERGMPPAAVAHLKPWALLLILSMPPATAEPVLDLRLYQRAMQLRKPVKGLETLAEQLSVFQLLSLDDQIALLEATLRERAQLPQVFTALLDAYLARDLAALMRLGQTLTATNPKVEARLRRALIEDRNQRMFDRLLPGVQAGARFIAVGALHLPGANGLLQRLQAEGIEVTRLY